MNKLLFGLLFTLICLPSFAAALTAGKMTVAASGTQIQDSIITQVSAVNIGIGTATPRGTLDVRSAAGVDGFIYGNGSQLTGIAASITGSAPIYVTGSNVTIDLTAYAPKASPTFTGTVSGVTAAMVGLGNVANTAQVTSVTASGNLASSGTTTPAITITTSPNFTNGLTIGGNSTLSTVTSGTQTVTGNESLSGLQTAGSMSVTGGSTFSGLVTVNSMTSTGQGTFSQVNATTFVGALTGHASSDLPAANPTYTGTMGTPLTASRCVQTDGSGNLSVATGVCGSVSGGSASGWTTDGATTIVTSNGGNVGIGTSIPTSKLEVVGGSKFSPYTYSDAYTISQTTNNSQNPLGTTGAVIYWEAQSFKTIYSNESVKDVQLLFGANTGAPTSTVRVEIQTDNSGVPSGTKVTSSAFTTFTPTPSAWNTATFATPVPISSYTSYWLVFSSTVDQTNENFWALKYQSSDVYSNGVLAISSNKASSWTAYASYDNAFTIDSANTTPNAYVNIASSNVGISTTNPTAILAVNGPSNAYSVASSNGFVAGDTTNNSMAYFFNNVNNSAPGNSAGFLASRTLTGDLNTHAFQDSSILRQSGAFVDGYASYDAQPYADNGNQLNHLAAFQARLTNNASSGITAYMSSFDVPVGYTVNKQGTVPSYYGMRLNDITNSNGGAVTVDYGIYIGAVASGTTNYQIFSNGGANSYFGGNVGIGSTAPANPLDINSAYGVANLKSTTGTNAAWTQYVNTGGTFYVGEERSTTGGLSNNTTPYYGVIAHSGNYGLNFGTNNYTRMTIDNYGKVGIGTTSPAYTLDVTGQMNVSSATTISGLVTLKGGMTSTGSATISGDVTIGSGVTTTYFTSSADLGVKGALEVDGGIYGYGTIQSLGTGNFGIGTVSPAFTLEVVGSIRASNTIEVDGGLYGGGSFPVIGGSPTTICWNATGKFMYAKASCP